MFAQDSTLDGLDIPRTCFRSFAIRAIIGGAVIFTVIFLSAVFIFGSIYRALAALRGDEVIIESVILPSDASQPLSIVAVNLSSNEVIIVGAESGCGCIEFGGLPAKVPPRGSCVIYARNEPEFKRTVASKAVIYTTSRTNPRMVAIVPP